MSSNPPLRRKPAMTNGQIRSTLNSINRQKYKNALRQFQQNTSSGSNNKNLRKGMRSLLEGYGGRRSRRTRKQKKRHTHRRR